MKPNEKDKQPKRSKSTRSLKDKIHKHISDKNDVITEDDLKNIQVGEDSFEKEQGAIDDLPDQIDKESKELSSVIPKSHGTNPWNILDDEDA